MDPIARNSYNNQFTQKKYQSFLNDLNSYLPNEHTIPFRIAETPLFINKAFSKLLVEAGNSICKQIMNPAFKALTQNAIPEAAITLNESDRPNCLVIDFAIAETKNGSIQPMLIELQGFPSLFGFELLHNTMFKTHFKIPENYHPFLNGYNENTYLTLLKEIILGVKNKHTILLEIFPEKQKTYIDFYYTQQLFDLPIVCLSEVFIQDQSIYYLIDGVPIKIERIYNRIVWEELKNADQKLQNLFKEIQVIQGLEWVTHPHHFFRYSKFSIPFLEGPYIPKTQFLNQISTIPTDLENYVLKPLFSFAGQGVLIDLDLASIQSIPDPKNWILQEKVHYAEIIETPTGKAKTEIRIFYFWDENKQTYIATLNLARISKGKMIGVNYNQAATWVGGSLAYFEL